MYAREGKTFWVCTYPKARESTPGLASLRISRTVGFMTSSLLVLMGSMAFLGAIASVFPQTTVQLCIVHQIRNSVKYVASKNQKEFVLDLKFIYQAVNMDAVEKALDDLELKWKEDYSIVIRSRRDHWDRLIAYFQSSQHISRIIIYTPILRKAITANFVR